MEINFGSYQLRVNSPRINISSSFNPDDSSRTTVVDLTLFCDYQEYSSISRGFVSVNNNIPKITVQNGNQLFIMHNCRITHIAQKSILGVSIKDQLELEITLEAKIIECQDLTDVFIE